MKVTITREQADALLKELTKRSASFADIGLWCFIGKREGWDLALLIRDVVLQWDKECAVVRAKNRKKQRGGLY